MPKRPRPQGVGRFNPDINALLNDVNVFDKVKSTNILFYQNPYAQQDIADVAFLDIWLLVIGATTFDWYRCAKNVETKENELLDSGEDNAIASLPSIMAEIPPNSMNVPVPGGELSEVMDKLNITP